MLRCVKPGCPTRCGSLRTPTCAERMSFYILMILFAIALIVSITMGVRWFREAGVQPVVDPGRASTGACGPAAAKGSALAVSGQLRHAPGRISL